MFMKAKIDEKTMERLIENGEKLALASDKMARFLAQLALAHRAFAGQIRAAIETPTPPAPTVPATNTPEASHE